jgi:hypothetical protein
MPYTLADPTVLASPGQTPVGRDFVGDSAYCPGGLDCIRCTAAFVYIYTGRSHFEIGPPVLERGSALIAAQYEQRVSDSHWVTE